MSDTIDLTEREMPEEVIQPGVFADVVRGKKTDRRGKEFTALTLMGQFAAVNSAGKRFMACKSYNLDNSRDINRLKADLRIWRGSDALPDLNKFNAEVEFLGKPFTGEPAVAKEDGKRVIRLTGFKPDPKSTLQVQDYIRIKDRQQTPPIVA
jgi:hypothetical protein